MEKILHKNPLCTSIILTDYEKSLVLENIRNEHLTRGLGRILYKCKHGDKKSEITVAEVVQDIETLIRVKEDVYKEELNRVVEELEGGGHCGDCTCAPCSCDRCYAEELAKIDTRPASKHVANKFVCINEDTNLSEFLRALESTNYDEMPDRYEKHPDVWLNNKDRWKKDDILAAECLAKHIEDYKEQQARKHKVADSQG